MDYNGNSLIGMLEIDFLLGYFLGLASEYERWFSFDSYSFIDQDCLALILSPLGAMLLSGTKKQFILMLRVRAKLKFFPEICYSYIYRYILFFSKY